VHGTATPSSNDRQQRFRLPSLLQGGEQAKAVLSEASLVTIVDDREGDIYEKWVGIPTKPDADSDLKPDSVPRRAGHRSDMKPDTFGVAPAGLGG
jgi:hypothetical protein